MIKKLFSLGLIIILSILITSCGNNDNDVTDSDNNDIDVTDLWWNGIAFSINTSRQTASISHVRKKEVPSDLVLPTSFRGYPITSIEY